MNEHQSITQRMEQEMGPAPHGAGVLSYRTLQVLEDLLGGSIGQSAETGCGRSTILLSNLADRHHVFCLDDTESKNSSVTYYQSASLTRSDQVNLVFGSTQRTVPEFEHEGLYDCVIIDGPHGFPFPELEYFHFYPRIKKGGILVVDDVQIPTIGRMADILQEDEMWELVRMSGNTVFFRRTMADALPDDSDGWWAQGFNRRRTVIDEFKLNDGRGFVSFADRFGKSTIAQKIRRRVWRLFKDSRWDRRAYAR